MPEFLTVDQVADELQVSVHEVRMLIRNHDLPATQQSGRYLVERQMLERWLQERYAETRAWVDEHRRRQFHADWKDFPVTTRR